MLEKAKNGIVKTQLRSLAYVPPKSFPSLLKQLEQKGLIEQKNGKWFTTLKGRIFINRLDKLETML